MENANISKIREKVDEYLSLLEQAGRESFDFLEAATRWTDSMILGELFRSQHPR
jgi:hypothetical protein